MTQYNIPFYEYASSVAACDLDKTTKSQLEQFSRDGYLIFDPGIDEDILDQAREHQDSLLYNSQGELIAKRAHNAWKTNSAIRQIACAPRILNLLETLYGREPIPFQTLNFPVGTQQRTHCDAMHFNTLPPRFVCGVWVALEDVDKNNGPVHYYPGSHKLPEFQMFDCFGDAADNIHKNQTPKMQDYFTYYEDFLENIITTENFERREIAIKKGHALIWSASLCHGGSKILDPNRTRKTQVTHYFFSNCLYYTPRLSHPYLNRLWLRCVEDLTTGENVPHKIGNRSFTVPKPGPYYLDKNNRALALDNPPLPKRVVNAAARRLKNLF